MIMLNEFYFHQEGPGITVSTQDTENQIAYQQTSQGASLPETVIGNDITKWDFPNAFEVGKDAAFSSGHLQCY